MLSALSRTAALALMTVVIRVSHHPKAADASVGHVILDNTPQQTTTPGQVSSNQDEEQNRKPDDVKFGELGQWQSVDFIGI